MVFAFALFGDRFDYNDVNTAVVNCPHLDLFDTVTFTETMLKVTMELPSISPHSKGQIDYIALVLPTITGLKIYFRNQ